MLATVNFDHQARRVADEIDYVRPDRHLPAKFCFLETAIPQREPEFPFGVGHVGPQGASPRDSSLWQALTRLAASPRGTLSRSGRGFWSLRRAHRVISLLPSPTSGEERRRAARSG